MASELSCVQVSREESKASQQKPWLLVTDGKKYHIQNSMFNNKPLPNFYYDVGGEIPEFVGRTIGCFFQEWVLLIGSYDDGLPEVLVNLLTKETIELPLLDFVSDFCILTSPPSDPTCHVVFFKKAEEENSLVIWQPGDREFTIKKWDFEIFPTWNGLRVVVAGKLFFDIIRDGERVLLMVEFKESTYRFEVIQMDDREFNCLSPWHQLLYSCDYYFFEYSGELFVVDKILWNRYSSNNVGSFIIHKADLLNKKWVRIKNLERLAIFICYKTGRGAAVDSGIAANSIYVLEHHDVDSYYVYNLDEGTIRMKPISCSMDTTEDMKLHWIMMHGDPPFPKLLKDDQVSMCQDSKKESKSSGEVEQDEVQESWNMVPPELLNLIQSRLFGRDYAVLGGVCKAWQQASIQWQQTSIQDYSIPSLLSAATLLEQCESSSPLLMYQEDITSCYDSVPIFSFFDPIQRKVYRTRIPELKEADIQHSRDGWLLVSQRSDLSIFFINPLTQEKIELPRMCRYPGVDFFSFSSPPTCSNCLVVGTNRFGSRMRIFTLKYGDKTWRKHELHYTEANRREDGKHLSQYNIVVLNGLHYFLCDNRDLVVFNLKDGAEVQLSDHQTWSSKFRRSAYVRGEDFLVEIDGRPAFVSVGHNGREISISKWNDMKKDWDLMEGDVEFGGKDMFLSKRCFIMEKIDDRGMGNTIFLPMIDDAKAGVFYSLATRRYHTFYSGYSSELPYGVDKFLDGVWVKPNRKIVGHNNLKWFG